MMHAQRFFKMTGSGNDFVFFDARREPLPSLETPAAISELCARGTGVGADGVVFLVTTDDADVGIRYYNKDGSRASLCGNATLCTTNLSVMLGAATPSGFTIATDAGIVQARIQDNLPEFDLPPAADLQPHFEPIPKEPGELRLGYVTAGVPHIVIQVADVADAPVFERGQVVRYHPSLPHGANVNFVSRRQDGSWSIRTYERGVEDETLACGTGNAAAAILLREWGEVEDRTTLWTKSGQPLGVILCRHGGAWLPSLRGEGRLVFTGELPNR